MQVPSALSLGEHQNGSMYLFKPRKGDFWFYDETIWAEKRSTAGVLLQDQLKAVTLAHQYNNVSRIAWLCSWKHFEKKKYRYYCYFLSSGVLSDELQGSTLQKRNRGYLVYGETQEGCVLMMGPIRAISQERERRRTFDKSIFASKLSALQHRCLRLLRLFYCEQRYNI